MRSTAGESSNFRVDVGLHQGSTLRTFFFIMMIDALTEKVRKEVPESTMFAEELVMWGGGGG